eukprot:GFYU01001467.1.p2 GENE.GFYU01001467.1~~GFYU01001467.1.p2  ORF type:complete len:230 (-),score=56.52 GFYU01001467.1:1273-1890(-)
MSVLANLHSAIIPDSVEADEINDVLFNFCPEADTGSFLGDGVIGSPVRSDASSEDEALLEELVQATPVFVKEEQMDSDTEDDTLALARQAGFSTVQEYQMSAPQFPEESQLVNFSRNPAWISKPEDDQKTKKLKTRMRNRESAQLTREKTRQYIQALEARLKEVLGYAELLEARVASQGSRKRSADAIFEDVSALEPSRKLKKVL